MWYHMDMYIHNHKRGFVCIDPDTTPHPTPFNFHHRRISGDYVVYTSYTTDIKTIGIVSTNPDKPPYVSMAAGDG